MLAPSQPQAEVWRRRHRLASADVVVIDTSRGYVPPGLVGPLKASGAAPEVVLLEGWRRGRYAERLTWQLARQGFDFSAVHDAR